MSLKLKEENKIIPSFESLMENDFVICDIFVGLWH
jgi:hypothetical protein